MKKNKRSWPHTCLILFKNIYMEFTRRSFIKQNTLAGIGTVLAVNAAPSVLAGPVREMQIGDYTQGTLDTLGGMTLQQLLDHHYDYLNKTYIPNWDRGVDWQYGGFTNAAIPGKEPSFEKKGMYFQGRAIWMFSYLYNHITHDKRHLEAAIKGRDFVVKHALTDDYRWRSFVSRDGKPLSEPLDHYGDIYMVLGLAELYKATKDEKDIELAINSARSVMKRLLSPSYQHVDAHVEALEPGTRRLPSWQHFLSALTPLLKVRRDQEIEFIALYCVRAICEKHWQPDSGVLLEMLDDRFRPYTFDAPNWGDFKPRGISGWHSIQACWMVMDDALRVNHYPTYRQGVQMGISTIEKCYIDGKGIPFSTPQGMSLDDPKAKPNINSTYPWGALDDMLVYCLMVLEHNHDPFAINYYNKCFELHNSKPGNVVTTGLLHTPRRFFYSIEILKRMIERGGKVSGEFSEKPKK